MPNQNGAGTGSSSPLVDKGDGQNKSSPLVDKGSNEPKLDN
ncbi:hypothetical protein [Gilliamella sp. ESL0250]|nr:hypothetical protein [Gilliamella sp. ESL0250]